MNHANMWRISDDFWDRWLPLYGMFGRLEKWMQYRTEGAWPDADMLPFGIVEFDRPTRFTREEQKTCMSLWCIARSPLILGADMTKQDPFSIDLLTNPEVLAVNKNSTNNRQLSRDNDPFDLSYPDYQSRRIDGEPKSDVIDIEVPIKNARRLVLAVGDGGNGAYTMITRSGSSPRFPARQEYLN
ncbi:MAG: hypothetical protein JXR25_16025 [Pontiellaceae bacterium]|nr:hypothetical protein [Pontiellaceae bacterium]MBN2786328.1 hypothetical protein [Pontiellaceae bacterium]